MAVKKRNKKPEVTPEEADLLADKLSGKPYGETKDADTNKMTTTSFSLPQQMLYDLEDLAVKNKRRGVEPKSVSALIREGVEKLLINN